MATALRILVFVGLGTVALAGAAVTVNRNRFARRVARETGELWASATEPRRVDRTRIQDLPSPARAYLSKALGRREEAVLTARLRHGGRFRAKLDGAWRPIRGQQSFAADPLGFVWWGRLHLAPGVWVDARDRCLNGAGSMRVSFESSFTLADRAGPELDQGALLRLLSELVLLPTALADGRYVTWSAVDGSHARAMLRLNGREVAGVFEFGADGLPRSFMADRYLDTGDGRAELTPWSGEYADYREVEGLLVPHRLLGYWHLDSGRVPYADFQLEGLEYDARAPL